MAANSKNIKMSNSLIHSSAFKVYSALLFSLLSPYEWSLAKTLSLTYNHEYSPHQ